MTACYCDYDETFSVYRKAEHTARKPHKCYECGRTINPGERYESAFGIYDGTGYTMPTCPHCLALREWVVAHVPCSCWTHGNVLENMADEVSEYGREAPGLTFGYLRRLVRLQRARGWTRLRRPFRHYVSPAKHAKLVAAGELNPSGVLGTFNDQPKEN